jgi:hypothetical protein
MSKDKTEIGLEFNAVVEEVKTGKMEAGKIYDAIITNSAVYPGVDGQPNGVKLTLLVDGQFIKNKTYFPVYGVADNAMLVAIGKTKLQDNQRLNEASRLALVDLVIKNKIVLQIVQSSNADKAISFIIPKDKA